MRNLLISLILLVSGCNCAISQLIEVVTVNGIEKTEQVTKYQVDTNLDGIPDFEQVLSTKQGKKTEAEAKLLVINTEAANYRLNVEDADRNPVEIPLLKGDKYLIAKPGKYWVRVTAIDFEKNIFDEETKVITLGKPEPPKPDPEDVDDTYGLGSVAAQYRPSEDAAKRLSETFRKAGDYLYGKPSLKVVSSANNNNPDVNVIAWLDRELRLCSAEDCQTFRTEIWKAFKASQQRRPYTREDWFAAFKEVSEALKGTLK